MAILISTPQDLYNVRNNLTGNYELANDIDMSSWGNFIPISKSYSPSFKGTFDGKGYKIKNLTINESTVYVGLFGVINNASTIIKNVGLENCNISGGGNANWIGGIVGQLDSGSIQNCYTKGQITGRYMVGGIVGQFVNGSVKNCYSHANITGLARVGGLVGYIATSTAIVENCYSIGKSTHTEVGTSFPAGGLIGDNEAATNVKNSFWDTQTSGLSYSVGGSGKTTAEMKTQSTYTNWDFSTVWAMNSDYPYLQVFGLPIAPPKVEKILVNSLTNNIYSKIRKSQKSKKQLNTFIDSILTNSKRYTATSRRVKVYLSQINSTAEKYSRTVRSATESVNSFILPIGSSVHRESKTIQNLIAHIKPLSSNTVVLYPLNTITPNAYVSTLKNTSRAFKMDNMTAVSYVVNPSFVEVMK
ncbi:GLUG motif-containing protein [Neobacillus vireti]|uniref:GLUG domain-containing protein n=1 Tax=Neobacillus vireti LMG 21834 TaxID=1131730 RepID=A0AB94IMD4_9BACI|nr:GLUG motif-containing protein [Neobacillus vireti]ETI68128.1 hypothetical protein BAVI_14034 [Neobacillus vireti LMG 21834]KLT15913.1 hypothetical protein AA980_22225 [Neobacillus vireti]